MVDARRVPPRWKNFALLFTTLAIGLGICELFVRAFIPVRDVGPRFAVWDPVYGKVLRKNFTTERRSPEATYTFTTNSLGARGPEPRKAPGPLLFLGDSFVMGYGVTDEKEFPAIVRRSLESSLGDAAPPVINFGIGNTGNGRWIRFLEREGEKFQPRMIVFQFCTNDFTDNVRERFFALGRDGALIEDKEPVKKGVMRTFQETIDLVPGLTSSYLFNLGLEAITANDRPLQSVTGGGAAGDPRKDPRFLEMNALTAALVGRSLAIAREHGWPTILIMIDDAFPEQRDELRKVAEAYDTPIVEIPSKKDRPDLYFRVDAHWNETGHAFVAEQLLAHERFKTKLLARE